MKQIGKKNYFFSHIAAVFIFLCCMLVPVMSVSAKDVTRSDLVTAYMIPGTSMAIYMPKDTPAEAWSTKLYFSNGNIIVPLDIDWFIKYTQHAELAKADYDKDGQDEVVIHYDFMGGTGIAHEIIAYVENPESSAPVITYYSTGSKDWVEEPELSHITDYLAPKMQAAGPKVKTKVADGIKEKVVWGECCRVWLYGDKILVEAMPENSRLLFAEDVASASFNVVFNKKGVPSVKYLPGKHTPDTLLDMAYEYVKRTNTGKMPEYYEVDHVEADGTVALHFYDLVTDEAGYGHSATYNWYYINPATAKGMDITEQPVDLN